jgi:hypothetical protein
VRSGRSFGAMAIVVILAGVVIFVLLSKIIASIYRSFIPFVPGPQIADAYWSSIVAALKLSLVLIGIISVCILLLFIKFTKKRK